MQFCVLGTVLWLSIKIRRQFSLDVLIPSVFRIHFRVECTFLKFPFFSSFFPCFLLSSVWTTLIWMFFWSMTSKSLSLRKHFSTKNIKVFTSESRAIHKCIFITIRWLQRPSVSIPTPRIETARHFWSTKNVQKKILIIFQFEPISQNDYWNFPL